MPIVLDAGAAIIKARAGSKMVAYDHALVQITEARFWDIHEQATQRREVDPNYCMVNGEYYAVAQAAERSTTKLQKITGAARYRKDYLGVFAAITMAQMDMRGGEKEMFVSFPPGLRNYRSKIHEAVLGEWTVQPAGAKNEVRHDVVYVNSFFEPHGGLMNLALTEEGHPSSRYALSDEQVLVVDVGGHTVDFLRVLANEVPDKDFAESVNMGVLQVYRDFERALVANHRDFFQNTRVIAPERIRDAIRDGKFKGGGTSLDCRLEATQATNALMNGIRSAIDEVVGGLTNYDAVVLTGGGAGALEHQLRATLDHARIVMASEVADIHMANVNGGWKLWKFMDDKGLLS